MPKRKQIKKVSKKINATPLKVKLNSSLKKRSLKKGNKRMASSSKSESKTKSKSRTYEKNEKYENSDQYLETIRLYPSRSHPPTYRKELTSNIFDKLFDIHKKATESNKSTVHWSVIPIPNLLHDIRHTFFILQKWFSPFLCGTKRMPIPKSLLETCIKPKFSDFIEKLCEDLELQALFLLAIHECIGQLNCAAFVEERVTKKYIEDIHCFNHVALYEFSGENCNLWEPITNWDKMPDYLNFLNSLEFPNVKKLHCLYPRHLEKLRLEVLKKLTYGPQSCHCCRSNFENNLKHHPDKSFIKSYSNELPLYGPHQLPETLETANTSDEIQSPPLSGDEDWEHKIDVQLRCLMHFAVLYRMDGANF